MNKKLCLIPALALLSFASCNFNSVKGNGHVVSKNYTQTGFRDIDAGSATNIILKQGPDFSVRIDAEENLLQLMKINKEGDKLVIGFKNNVSVSPTKDINIYITAPEYRNLEGSGACTISSVGMLSGREINIGLSGASNARLNVEVQKLEIDASGASEIEVKGKAVDFSIDGSGSTSVNAYDLFTENTEIGLSGSGDVDVSVTKTLKVDISGAGSVQYKGNPTIVKQEISGAGSIKKAD